MKVLTSVLLGVALGHGVPAHGQTPDSIGAAVTAAQAAARSWLSLVDRRQYSESWDSAASFFRKAVTKPAWEVAVRNARSPFETFGSRKLLTASYQTKLPNAPPGEYFLLQYRVGIAGGKTVVETVTPMKDQDGSWRVSGYYIRPE